jgi:hypothetical protein
MAIWPEFVAFAAATAVPVAMSGRMLFARIRGRRRNAREACSDCGGPLYAPRAFAGPSMADGVLVCEPCAERRRTRTRGTLLAAAGLTASATVATAAAVVAGAASGPAGWVFPLAVLGEYALLFGGAVALMKRRNRLALRKLDPEGLLLAGARSRRGDAESG